MTATRLWLKTCPLCGGENRCALAAGQPADSCWCAQIEISSAALAAIPAEAPGQRCLCRACCATGGETVDER